MIYLGWAHLATLNIEKHPKVGDFYHPAEEKLLKWMITNTSFYSLGWPVADLKIKIKI